MSQLDVDQRRQMLTYEKQLELKRTVVEKAYRNFSSSSHLSFLLPLRAHYCLRRYPCPPDPHDPTHDAFATPILLPYKDYTAF